MSSLIIFGAGASSGSDTRGVPPLGSTLFSELSRFAPSVCEILTKDQKTALSDDFEEGMKLVGETNSHALPVLQRAMAVYFFNFQPLKSNLYFKLAQRIKSRGWSGAIATLNYERLLESSLIGADLHPVIGSPSNHDRIELCLPHGSCHLFCDGPKASPSVSFSGIGVVFDSPRIKVISDPTDHQREIESNAIPPVMSYFHPGKVTSAGRNFIEAQRVRFSELISSSDRIVIVGVRQRLHDRHIWEPLKNTNSQILYCSGSGAAAEYKGWSSVHRSGQRDIVLSGHFKENFEDIISFVGI